ncbi:MAG TPA: metal ABC transporter ATP-binding protein, partial [Acidimicrobiaceae bacterium]|nr:metal ABC transporter ATP-binding protein [Acidimicrobiaceae bacterium]
MFAVETRDLQVRFGNHLALSDLTMQVPLGSSVAVVGANGSGKSTLLGALAGLRKPTSGTVETIDSAALVLQATEVEAGLPITVLDAVRLGRYPLLGLTRRFRDVDREAVSRSVERMGIESLLDMRLQELSGGQRQ